ncbi:PREDICTED: spondin-1 [Bactrocera latifrons]|uniref:spondin-1 n=1 Tax=Bactrocera latifrons TaxID=174628 RepID=UPI0008DD83D3|nr:PREDICTED: spondin-1 [Bactrocera latifrons]
MFTWLHLLLVLVIIRDSWQICDRRPQGATGERSAVDENFQVLIQGNPKTFIPGQTYNISLSVDVALKFLSFTLVVESEDDNIQPTPDTVGYFEIIDKAETRFSTLCENMIESTNANTKVRVSVGWVAPNGGCVLIKAAVLQHRSVWYMDDGFLTKRICAEEIDEVNSQTPALDVCCACDEAKYELIVERKWGRNTHPHNFPAESWRTRFSELIGASHTPDYRFWQYGELASRGLQEMAEHGATRLLEMEIKSGDVRTIIKAPGIIYRQNTASTTLANVRVDRQHHVISLVSKIEPSPDWILGVAGLELCLENCTWVNEKVLNLYPWDIGTDAGPSYMSPDQPQKPPDVVRRITSTSPNDQRSPFYEETGKPMKALATLYVRRKKLYERECDSGKVMPLECATHPWSAWSECTTRCGRGKQYRTRAYKDPDLATSFSCQAEMEQEQNCVGEQCRAVDVVPDDGEAVGGCELTPWSAWSACSRRCGRGYMTRSREYVNPYEREQCLNDNPVELEQRRDCEGRDCGVRRTQQDRDEDVNENENDNDNVAVEDVERNYEIDDNKEEDEEENGEGDINRLPQPELFGRRRPEFSNRRTNSYYNGRQTDWGDNDDSDRVAEGVEDDNMQIDNKSEQEVEDRPYGNRGGFVRGRQRNRYSGGATGYDSYDNNEGDDEDNNSNLHEVYDEDGHKAILVGASDPNNYDVLQRFCFEKPFVRTTRCDRRNLGFRNYWFYDADERECQIFTADGCDENKNKFRTLSACEGTCLLPHSLYLSQPGRDEDNGNGNGWSRQFGESESLVRKPKKKSGRKNRKRKQNYYVGNIKNYSFE